MSAVVVTCPRCQQLAQSAVSTPDALECPTCSATFFWTRCPSCQAPVTYAEEFSASQPAAKCSCGCQFYESECPQCQHKQLVVGSRGQCTVTCAQCRFVFHDSTCPKCGLQFKHAGLHSQPSTSCPSCSHTFFQAECPTCHVASYYEGHRHTSEHPYPSTSMTCGCGQRFYDATCPGCQLTHTYTLGHPNKPHKRNRNRLQITRCKGCNLAFFEVSCPHCHRAQAFGQPSTLQSHLQCRNTACGGSFFPTHCMSCTKLLMFKGKRDGSWLKCSCSAVFSELLCPHCSTVCCVADTGQTDFYVSCHSCHKTFPQFPEKVKQPKRKSLSSPHAAEDPTAAPARRLPEKALGTDSAGASGSG
eukprot:RCo011103